MNDDPKGNFEFLVLTAFLAYLARGASAKGKAVDADEVYEFKPLFGVFSTQNVEFGRYLLRVLDLLEDYATRSRVDRPLNILLAASPGTGKSFLAKQLAKALETRIKGSAHGKDGVSFEEVHVAAFRSADDLIGVFQRVQSSNLRGYLPFVLFDEVDGKVAGNYLLANFLAPMWDGKFHEGRDSYALGPAVFCFAASALIPSPEVSPPPAGGSPPSASTSTLISYSSFVDGWLNKVWDDLAKQPTGEPIPKRKDFIDRTDVMLCIPPVDEQLLDPEKAAREYMDLAYSWVIKHFPHVTRIEKAALTALGKELVRERISRRAVEKCVFASTTPKDGTFLLTNLPLTAQKKYSDDQDVRANQGKFFAVKKRA